MANLKSKNKNRDLKDVSLDMHFNTKQYEALATSANEVMYGGAKGGGKLLDLNTDIITTVGWKKMKDIHPGEYVFGDDGKPTLVVAESKVDIEEDTYEVYFDDGSHIVAGSRHQWYTQTLAERNSNKKRTPEARDKRRKSRPHTGRGKRKDLAKLNSQRKHTLKDDVKGGIRTTEEILETLKVGKMSASNHAIPVAEALLFPEVELPIHPYVLGAWLGDGNTDSGGYSGIDPEIWERFEDLGYKMSHYPNGKAHCILGIVGKLRDIGTLNRKHIPDMYKYCSFQQRLELLQGLMDSDGHVEKNGGCQLSLSDEVLANDALEVIRSLGIKCSSCKNKSFLYGVRKKDRYRMSFTTTLPVCYLPRKATRIPSKVRPTTRFWYITDVVKVEKQPKKCIQVDNSSHLYLVGKNLIPTHNSWLARHAALLYCQAVPGLQVYIFRRTFAEVRGNFLFGDSGFIAMLQGFVDAGLCNINLSENRIHFYNGSDIYLRHMQTPQDVESIRGRDIHVLICDEATQWLTRDVYNQLRTCMRCSLAIDYEAVQEMGYTFITPGYFPRAYLLTNPGGIAHAFIKAEFIDAIDVDTPTQMPPEKGGMIRQFIPAFLEDNTALMKTDPNYKNKLIGSGRHVKAMLKGDWSIPEGAALADEWSHEFNTIEPFQIPAGVKIKRCFDWGTAKPFACSYCWESKNEEVTLLNGDKKVFPVGTFFVVGEVYGWNGNPDEGCRKTNKQMGVALKEYEMLRYWGNQVVAGPSDGSIFNGTGTDMTINDDIIVGFNSVCDEDLPYTRIQRSTLFLRADKSKGSRAKGLSMVKSYLQGAHNDEDGNPSERAGLIFFTTAEHCIRTLPVIPYDILNPDDIDTKAEDHIYDTVRYAVLGRARVFKQLNVVGY